MSKKQIKIRIYPNGRIESETVGIKGKECMNYLKDIENLTGAKITTSAFTQEYYQTESQQHSSSGAWQSNGY